MTARWVVLCFVAPLLLGAESERRPLQPERKLFLLKLHAPEQSGVYFTAWADGDVVTSHDGSDGRVVVYKRRFIWYDSCEWESTETLTPVAADQYKYKYREQPMVCPKGVTSSGLPTPKDGHVTVHKLDVDKPLTPLFAWIHDWQLRSP